VSSCLIEQKLTSRGYADGTDFAATPITAKGLAALEYLLFYEGTDNACASNVSINTSGAWAALGEAELRARKAAYAAVIATDVARRADALANAWAPSGENFADSLKTAGRGSTVYGTDQMALNAVSDALFYIESETKDMKVAFALGLGSCGSRPCPLSTESPYARVSAAHAVSNIAAFDELLTGRPVGRTGFVGLLDSVGARELADKLQADVDEAQTAAAELSADAFENARDDEAVKGKVARVHEALRMLAIDLKSQFLSLLDLELPKRVEGDND
jgi:predicted lipoprotein